MLLAFIALIYTAACPLSLALPKDQMPVASVGEINASDNWEASPSRDVVKYVVYRGCAMDSLEPIGEVNADTSGYTDENRPMGGSYSMLLGL